MNNNKVSVLLVDGQPTTITALAAVLPGLNGVLVTVSGAAELADLSASDYALAIIDLQADPRRAFDAAESLATRQGGGNEVPLIFVGARADLAAHAGRAYTLGAADCVETPLDPAALRAKLAVFIMLHCRHAASSSRQRSEHKAAIKNREDRLRLILENTRDYAFIVTDTERIVTEWEGGATAITGWSADEARGQSADLIFAPEDRASDAPQRESERARATGRAEDKRWHLRRDGSRFFADGVMVALRDEGALRGYAKIFRDATAEHDAGDRLADSEARLSQSIARFALLLDSAGEGIYGVDENGRCSFLNAAGAAMLGYRPEELVGRELHDLIHHHYPDGRRYPPEACRLANAARSGQPERVDDEVFWRKDGQPVPVFYSVNPMRIDGRVAGAVVTFSDTSRRRQEELERERLYRQVGAANDQLADIFQRAPAFMCILRGAGHVFESVNQRFEQLVGARAVLGQPVREAMPELEGQGLVELMDEVYRGGEPFEGANLRVLLRRDGAMLEERYLDFVLMVLREPDGVVKGLLLHGVDVTERTRATRLALGQRSALELAVSEAPLGDVLDVLARAVEDYSGGTGLAAVELIDADGRLRHAASPSLDPDYVAALDAMPLARAVSPSARAAREGVAITVSDIGADPAWSDYRNLAQGQDLRAIRATPILAPDGAVLGVFSWYYREPREPLPHEREALALLANTASLVIGQRHEAQERQAAEDRAHDILESISEGFLAIDAGWRITYANSAAEQVTGIRGDQLAGALFAEVFPASLGALIVEGNREAGAARGAHKFEAFYPPLGRRFEINSFPTPDGGVALYFRDITEQKRAEDALRRVAADLAEADHRKSEFLATLAHELRNPLAPIRTGLDLIRMAPGDARAMTRVHDMMDRQLGHLIHLVNDLLDVARITRGKIELKKETVELQSLVAMAVETSTALVESSGHSLKVELPAEPLALRVDVTRIVQVLSNLLNNAAKYTPPGGSIRLAAWREGTKVALAVSDSGIGIPPDALGTVFEMFTQVRSNMERSQGGLGIGLSLVLRLVELHGGTVDAASLGSGHGSTFTVRLPLAARPGRPREDDAALPGVDPDRPPLRVLVVDDNGDAAESLAALLALLGHATRVALDGYQGLQLAQEFAPDLIFLDIGLPGMSGHEVARAIRKTPGLRDVVLIALTGWGARSDVSQSREAGFDQHLTKPVSFEALEQAVAAVRGGA